MKSHEIEQYSPRIHCHPVTGVHQITELCPLCGIRNAGPRMYCVWEHWEPGSQRTASKIAVDFFGKKAWIMEWKLNNLQMLPSWELTYPHPRHVWRWFTFSQGGICDPSLEGNQQKKATFWSTCWGHGLNAPPAVELEAWQPGRFDMDWWFDDCFIYARWISWMLFRWRKTDAPRQCPFSFFFEYAWVHFRNFTFIRSQEEYSKSIRFETRGLELNIIAEPKQCPSKRRNQNMTWYISGMTFLYNF